LPARRGSRDRTVRIAAATLGWSALVLTESRTRRSTHCSASAARRGLRRRRARKRGSNDGSVAGRGRGNGFEPRSGGGAAAEGRALVRKANRLNPRRSGALGRDRLPSRQASRKP
jgi:hypothetical protein